MFAKALRHVRSQWMGALALWLVLASGVAYATNGDFLKIGIGTTAESPTSLIWDGGASTEPVLKVTSPYNSGQPAASFTVTGKTTPPFTVSSRGHVARLNADQLDGLNSTQLASTAVNVDIPKASSQTAPLAGGFQARFDCNDGVQIGWELLISSAQAGDMNWAVTRTNGFSDTAPVYTDGRVLPAGQFVVLEGFIINYRDVNQSEGQVVLHVGANVTAFTFHAISNTSTGRCQLFGVATPGV